MTMSITPDQCYFAFCFMCLLLCFGLVFKVIAIEESGFVEKTNLRVGRINLNFSITDVQWHPVDGKYIIKYYQRSFFIRTVRIWNALADDIGLSVTLPLSSFNARLLSYYKQSLCKSYDPEDPRS